MTPVEDLIKTVVEKVGLPADKAKMAVETVMNFLKEKLPGGMGGQLEELIKSGGDKAGDIAKKIGGMFGS
jgi:nucleoid DNA-binding protein